MRELCQDLGSPAVSRYRQRHNMEMFASTAKLCGWQKWGLEDFGHKKWSCLRQCVCSGALCGVILPHTWARTGCPQCLGIIRETECLTAEDYEDLHTSITSYIDLITSDQLRPGPGLGLVMQTAAVCEIHVSRYLTYFQLGIIIDLNTCQRWIQLWKYMKHLRRIQGRG